MTREETQPCDGNGAGYAIPIQVGIIGGFFAVALPLVLGTSIYFRDFPQIFYKFLNFQFENTHQLQCFILYLIGSIILGFVTGYMTGHRIRKVSDVIGAGIISGIFSGIVVITCIVNFSYYFWFADMSIPQILEDIIPIMISTLFYSIVFQVLGAIGGYLWYRNRQGESPSRKNQENRERIIGKPAIVVIILIILVLIIPLTIVPLANPKPDPQKCFMFTGDYAKIERLNEDTIKITQIGANSPADCLSNKPYLVKISLNDKDVSDLASIQKQGLSDTIDPPEGLVYANGSTIVIKGPEVSNKTHAPFIKMMKNMQSRFGTLIPLSVMADGYV